MRRLGILGGSFDPIHNGHMHMAVSACRYFDLSEVWLVPAGHSPNKNEAGMTAAEHRFRMCELAAAGAEGIRASRLELDCAERSYTYRTLERLKADMPSTELYFIMGGDSLDYFDQWVKPERICELATILVVPRDSFETEALRAKIKELQSLFPCRVEIVPVSLVPLSSTSLREELGAGRADPGDFPGGVYAYIKEHGLYQPRNKGKEEMDQRQ
ncbi:MAG: nicotinate-nucleotide adenylyltransferase [Agathobacter sp.]|nr:nicotinate-nucleotide adenylyltransferase [Agathobacter sp.]